MIEELENLETYLGNAYTSLGNIGAYVPHEHDFTLPSQLPKEKNVRYLRLSISSLRSYLFNVIE